MKKFFKGIRGKQVLVSLLAIMVIAAGYYRWTVDRNGGTVPVMGELLPAEEQSAITEEVQESDYFAKARYERDCARSEAVELLTVAAVSKDGDTENIGLNNQKIEQYAESAENETAIENMVKSKGYDDCVAFVDDTGVRVVVKAEKLDAAGVAKIKDIIVNQTGAKPTEIKISNKN